MELLANQNRRIASAKPYIVTKVIVVRPIFIESQESKSNEKEIPVKRITGKKILLSFLKFRTPANKGRTTEKTEQYLNRIDAFSTVKLITLVGTGDATVSDHTTVVLNNYLPFLPIPRL